MTDNSQRVQFCGKYGSRINILTTDKYIMDYLELKRFSLPLILTPAFYLCASIPNIAHSSREGPQTPGTLIPA
jgi:hypothetical protein